MKILWLTENYPPRRGGMAQACDRIVSSLRQKRIQVDVAFFNASAGSFKVISQMNGKLIAIPVSDSPAHSLNLLYNFVSDESNALSYTHIVAFGGTLPMLALPIFKAWLGTKAITLLRGNDFDVGVFQPAKRQILFDALKTSNSICVLHKEAQRRVATLLPEANVICIPNGIDTLDWMQDPMDLDLAKRFRQEYNISENKLLVGIFGQLKEKKGVVLFLENLLKTGLQDKISFLFVGDIEEVVQTWINDNSGFESDLHIIQLPFMDRFELLSKYPACDFIALPSHYDGMPNVLLEAGALGIPAIAAKTGGILEVMPPEQNELLFYPGNSDQCRCAIIKACNMTKEERKVVGQALKDNIHKNFSAKKESNAYLELLLP